MWKTQLSPWWVTRHTTSRPRVRPGSVPSDFDAAAGPTARWRAPPASSTAPPTCWLSSIGPWPRDQPCERRAEELPMGRKALAWPREERQLGHGHREANLNRGLISEGGGYDKRRKHVVRVSRPESARERALPASRRSRSIFDRAGRVRHRIGGVRCRARLAEPLVRARDTSDGRAKSPLSAVRIL